MPRNASGTYTLPASNPVLTGTTITSTWANDTLSDLATQMTSSLDRSGRGGMLAALRLFDGVVGNPGLGFSSEPTSGLWRGSAGILSWSVLGAEAARIIAAGIAIPLGALATPSLSFFGDANTGVYSPGADRYRIVTGGTSRAEWAADGTLALGDNQTPNAQFRILLTGTGPAQSSSRGFRDNTTANSSNTADYISISTGISTTAAAFTLSNLHHFYANQGTIGAGSTVTNQIGYLATAALTGATNNYGFRGQIPAAANRWNVYMDGTAQNHFAGNVGIGAGKTVPAQALDVAGTVAADALSIAGNITGSLFFADPAADSAAAPAYSWTGDTNTGIYNGGNDIVGISLGGTARALFSTTGFTFGTSTTLPANTYGIIDRLGTSPVPALSAGTVLTLAGATAVGSTAYLQLISGNAANADIRFGDTDAAFRGAVQYDHTNDTIGLVSAGVSRFTINATGNAVHVAPSSGIGLDVAGVAGAASIRGGGAFAGGLTFIHALNSDTAASSDAAFIVGVAGTAAGDPYVRFDITGGTNWYAGTDNSDSDTFKIGSGSAVGTNNWLNVTTDGRVYGTALHNNAGAVTGTTNQYVASGTYTPTLTNTTNISSSTARVCQWMRVGNVVTVSGSFAANPTAGTANTLLGMSLPIASNFASGFQCAGTFNGDITSSQLDTGRVIADTVNDRASFKWTANTLSGEFYFSFTYLIV